MRIILASKSKARRALMKELGIPFECHTSGYEEKMHVLSEPSKLAQFLALEKARFIKEEYPESLIIGADTFVTIDKKKIGKPGSVQEAKEIIHEMSNNRVSVHSGIGIIKTGKKGNIIKEKSAHVVTHLSFVEISDAEIEKIVENDEVLSTSGAFSIEGEGGKFVKSIEGDYHNIIGLPLFQLKEMLQELGVKMPET